MNPTVRVPKLYIWSNQLLYLGVSHIFFREHMSVSDKLIVSIQGEINIKLDDGRQVATRSCLVKAGTAFDKEYIDVNTATMAIYYLAPLCQDYPALEKVMAMGVEGLHYAHPQEDLLIQTLIHIRDAPFAPEQVYDMLRDLIVQPSLQNVILREFDSRIVELVRRVRETVRENLGVNDFAAEVNLSESRLEKLFKDQIGIPITKYRLRYRVFVGIIHLALGQSVTDAALAAGFASSAHFSKTFSAINGVPPSAAFLKPPFLEVLISDMVFKSLSVNIDDHLNPSHRNDDPVEEIVGGNIP